MAHITADRVRQLSTSTGNGPFTVSTTFTGFRAFSSVLSVGDTFWYTIAHTSLSEWEVGLGTYSAANTITRTTVLSSSTGSAVLFSAGDKDVFITAAAGKFLQADAAGKYGIGTNSPTSPLTVYDATSSTILLAGDSGTAFISARSSNDTTAPGLNFRKYRGTTATPLTIVTGDSLGNSNYLGYDGSSLITAAQITGIAETVTGTGDISGALTFLTRPAGTGTSATERMRIDSAGNVTPGTTNTQTLGAVGDVWSNVHATTFTGALTGNASGSAATFTSTSQNSQFNSIGVGVAASSTAGQINAGNIIASGIVTGTGGIKSSDTSFPTYQILLDFGADLTGTLRKIITATLSAGTQYSTHGFKIKITDPNANHATQASVNVDEVVYYVACVRSEATVVDTPDLCVIRGPAQHVRAVKTATGTYEIQVQPEAQYREYLITIESYATNGSHTIVYSNGSTAGSAGTATYSAAVGSAITWVDKLQSTGTVTGTQLVSNIATGTAPLTVASTTLVTNLNADLLDGLNSATANTVSTIVARDASGNFSAGTITAALTGAASSNVLKAGDTMTGVLNISIGGGVASSTKHIALINGTGYDLFMLPRAAPGSYNTLTQAGDSIIGFSAGAIETGALVIGPWSASGKGIRIDSSGNVGIGSSNAAQSLGIGKPITGGATAIPLMNNGQVQTDVTGAAWMFRSSPTTVASAFTLPTLAHFSVVAGTLGASSTITNEYGALFQNTMVNATNIYGVSSNIVAQPFGAVTPVVGTATSISQTGTTVTVTSTAHTFATGQYVTVAATANVTALTANAWVTVLTVGTTDFTAIGGTNTVGASFTASGAGTGTGTVTLNAQGSGKNITVVDANTFTYTTTSANYAAITLLTGVITPATRWNIYAAGTASNYFAGSVGIGYSNSAGLTNVNLRLGKTMVGGNGQTTSYGIYNAGVVQSDVTLSGVYNQTVASSVGAVTNIYHNIASQGTFSGVVGNQYGYNAAASLIGATNNFGFYAADTTAVTSGKTAIGFYSDIDIQTGGGTTYGFYANGTATNYFNGNVGIGTSAPGAKLEVVGSQANFRVFSTDAVPFYIPIIKARGVAGTPITVNNNDNIGSLQFYAYNGTNEQPAATIVGSVDGVPSATSMPGRLVFSTTPAGTNVLAERMRIDNAGNVTPGVTNTQTLGAVGDVWSAVHATTVAATFHESVQTISTNYTITAGNNAMTPGPITIASGVTVTVPSGSVWTIV